MAVGVAVAHVGRLQAGLAQRGLVGGLVGLAFAAKGKPPEKLPKAVVANMTAQIGDVLEAQDVEHVFIVKNEGAAELQILDVRPG